MSAVVEVENLDKEYPGTPPVRALQRVTLTIASGEMLAIVGPSGSGKSTLLHIIGTLERPTRGKVVVAGHDLSQLADDDVSAVRAHQIGFVFQQFFLLENLSALENVALGLLYRGIDVATRRSAAIAALERIGLRDRVSHRPNQLSGGERQRVAIARAIVGRPAVIYADEPTGNLDSAAGDEVLAALRDLNADGITIAIITHDRDIAEGLPRRVEIKDGQIVADVRREAA